MACHIGSDGGQSVDPASLDQVKLLVVDADPDSASHIAGRLFAEGVGACCFEGISSIDAAVERLAHADVDLVLVAPSASDENDHGRQRLEAAGTDAWVVCLDETDVPNNQQGTWMKRAVSLIARQRRHRAKCRLTSAESDDDDGANDHALEAHRKLVVVTDADGRITDINPGGDRVADWSAPQALGRYWSDVFDLRDPTTGAAGPNPAESVMARNLSVDMSNDYLMCRRDHAWMPVRYSAAPMHDNKGAVVGAMIVFTRTSNSGRAGSGASGEVEDEIGAANESDAMTSQTAQSGITARLTGAVTNMVGRPDTDHETGTRYQPEFDPGSGLVACLGVTSEAMTSPARYLPYEPLESADDSTAEHYYFALEMACKQLAAWRHVGLRLPRLGLALSPTVLARGDCAARVERILDDTGMPPDGVEIAVSQSVVIANDTAVAMNLHALGDLGVRLAVYDFGTGLLGLDSLHHYGFETLKLDPILLQDVATSERARVVVSGAISLAQSLGCRLVAQGIESDEQLAFAFGQPCDAVSGARLAAPVFAGDAGSMLALSHGDVAHSSEPSGPRLAT